jgi:hypothetical protein
LISTQEWLNNKTFIYLKFVFKAKMRKLYNILTGLAIAGIMSSCTPKSENTPTPTLENTKPAVEEVMPTETLEEVVVEEPTITPTPTPTVTPEPTVYTIDDFVKDLGLDQIEDIMVEYQRTGKIYLDDLKDLAPDNLEDYLLAFRELDDDMYSIGHDEDGWFIDVNTYPADKTDNIEDIFRYKSGRTGDLVITDQDGNFVYSIANLEFYSPTPTPKPSGGSGGDGDTCPAPRQMPGGDCCPAGTEWDGIGCSPGQIGGEEGAFILPEENIPYAIAIAESLLMQQITQPNLYS